MLLRTGVGDIIQTGPWRSHFKRNQSVHLCAWAARLRAQRVEDAEMGKFEGSVRGNLMLWLPFGQ